MNSQTLVEKSILGNKWKHKTHSIQDINYMISCFGLSAVTSNALLNRLGCFDKDKISDYLTSDIEKWLPKVWELKDINFALDRIIEAINQKEKVCILGDYDVDGISSSIMLDDFLQKQGLETKIIIPNRLTERYGPTEKSFDLAKEFGASLCITVDCGSVAFDEIEYANNLGLNVVVFDHHLTDEDIVSALAIVNPNQHGDISGLNNLCAAGLIFFVIWALSKRLSLEWDYNYIDLAAIGTICDVMKLLDYNRDLVRCGIDQIKNKNCLSTLLDLFNFADIDINELNVQNISFGIGPRINAAARMGKHEKVLELFSSTCVIKKSQLLSEIDELNSKRKCVEKELTKLALVQNNEEKKFFLAVGEGWHDGVLGIIAGRLVSMTKKPSMVINLEGDIGKGSARSIEGFNIGLSVKKALEKDLLIYAGGHELAAGCSIKSEKIEEFCDFMNSEVENITFNTPEILIDSVIDPIACNSRLWNDMQNLEPYGNGNDSLTFMFPNVKIINFQKFDNYMSCLIVSQSGAKIKGVLFPHSAGDDLISGIVRSAENKSLLSCIGNFTMSKWKGKSYSSFMIKDIALVK